MSFTVNNTSYTISNIDGTYTTPQDLVDKLNERIQTDSALSVIKDKIKFSISSGYISIEGQKEDIRKIYFENTQKNDTYNKLFVGTTTVLNSISFGYNYGTVTRPQGSTAVTVTPATASVSIPADKQNSINITSNTNKIILSTSDGQKTVTLATGLCSIADIVTQMNAQLKPSANSYFSSIRASYENNRLIVTAIPSTDNPNGSYSVDFYGNCSAWQAIHGTHTTYCNPTIKEASDFVMGTSTAIANTTTVDGSNDELILTVGTDTATIHITQGTYNSKEALKNAVEAAINNNPTLKDKVKVDLKPNGTLVFSSLTGAIAAAGKFYENALITFQTENETLRQGAYSNSSFENAFIIGRKDLTVEPVDIVSGANDSFIFNFAYKDTTSHAQGDKSHSEEMEVTIPEGKYTGDEIAKVLQELMQKKFEEKGFEDFEIEVAIGGHDTQVVGANDKTALQIRVKRKPGKEPAQGQYVLDGIRGSAAGFLFYKTTINPNATFITGTKDLSKGVVFKPGQNVFTFTADGIPYQYTFPENKEYTGKEFIDLLNGMFANGDDNGNPAPLKASLENGALKISHKALGTHSITDIGGSARSTLFLEETGGTSREPLRLLVGSESTDTIDIPRTRVSSCSLAINTITISKPKYAEKAVDRLTEALIRLTDRRSTYGAMQNRLEHTINNNNNIIENTQSSESIIRDADMAFEAVEQAKSSVLVQVSHTILAQANQQLQQVMNLLQA